jgi:excisionase family DNA binding protein
MDTLLLSLEEAARQLGGFSTRIIRRMIEAGELPKVLVRRSIKIPATAVREWVDINMQPAHNFKRAGGSARR